MNRSSISLAAGCLLLGFTAGCAPSVLRETPASWPGTWKGRQLFHTPWAYIYARSPELAGQADRVAERVVRDFERAAQRDAPRGLLIISDPGDEPVCEPRMLVLAMAKESLNASELNLTDEELEARWQVTLRTTGLEPQDMLGMSDIPLDKDGILKLGLPPEAADEAGWAVLLPSDAMMSQKVDRLMSTMMDRAEIGVAAKVMMMPLLLAMRPKMAQMIAIQRQMVLFEQMAAHQPDWSPKQTARLSEAYADGTLKPAMDAIRDEIVK